MKVVHALLVILLLAPVALAQFPARTPVAVEGTRPAPGPDSPIIVELRIETKEDLQFRMPVVEPWIVAGLDNLLNLSIANERAAWLNATFRVNATGATVTPSEVTFSVPPYGSAGELVTIRADDVGRVEVAAEAIDAFQPSGSPLDASLSVSALLLPSMRFLDPPTENVSADDEFTRVDSYYGGPRQSAAAYIRIAPGDSIVPRIEVKNPFETATPGFTLTLRIGGAPTPEVEVPPLDARGTFIAEFPEYTPIESSFGPSYAGPMGAFPLQPIALVELAGATLGAGAATFRVERGAVLDVTPISALVEVQSGLALDIFVPTKPTLGAPTRIKYNATNLGTTTATGPLVVTVMTPSRIFYEVQGPETYTIQLRVPPREKISGAVDFTPRVTGAWTVSTSYASGEGPYSYGSGGGFEVPGPLFIGFAAEQSYNARIGEPLEVDVSLVAGETLPDARLRIGTGMSSYREPQAGAAGSAYRQGFADTLVESRTPSATIGTLRAGGAVNTTIGIVGRGSGSYTIVPYVLSEGFAYTSSVLRDPVTGAPVDLGLTYGYGAPFLNFVVHTRPVPPGLSLAPFTLGLAFFVGAWTLRTRFVR